MTSIAQHYYRHIDGGLYRSVCLARHADDGRTVVVYEHLWPFEPGIWVRDQEEFERRFTETSEAACISAMQQDREAAQRAVQTAKALRRQPRENLD